MLRKTLAVIIAYAVFAITAVLLFNISGHDPHQPATINFEVLTAVYGIFFSFVSGMVLQLIAKTGNLNLNFILALVIASFATFSLIQSPGSHWTQLFAIIIFAPASILGGVFYERRIKR